MRIHIFGAGAIGGFLALRLALGGHDVSVTARGSNLAAIERDRLRLQVGSETFSVRVGAAETAAAFGVQDLVIVAVKSTALGAAALQLGPLIGPHTQVVFAQNGIPWWYPVNLPSLHPPLPELPVFALGAAFLALMRPDQVVPGVVYSANEMLAPGVVRNNSPGHNALELASLLPQAEGPVRALRSLLEAAGIASNPVEDARASVWLKLAANASASPLALITGNPGAIGNDPALHAVFLRLVDECLGVAAACGYPLRGRLDLSRWGPGRARHKPSLLQDYEQGRPLELAEMVLAPVAFARSLGLPTPTLDAVAAIASRLAQDRGLYTPPAAAAAPSAPASGPAPVPAA
jgi:2-dehydropantoate 2-reductase